MSGRIAVAAGLAIAMTLAPLTATRGTFVPDWTFKGSTLDGWHGLGQADWKAADGVLIGTPKSPDGGWLVLDKSLQDVQFGFEVRCTGGCRTGVLLRAEKTPSGGLKGIFTSLVDEDIAGYAVTLDASGRELTRERLRPGGGMMRFAPTAAEAASSRSSRRCGQGRRSRRCRRTRRWRTRGAAQPAQGRRLERHRHCPRRQHPASDCQRPADRRWGGRRGGGQVRSCRAVCRGIWRGALPRRRVQGPGPEAVREGAALAEFPDAAPDAVLLLVLRGRGRHRSRRQHGRRSRVPSSSTGLNSPRRASSTPRRPAARRRRSSRTGSHSPAISPATAGPTSCSPRRTTTSST